MKRVILLLTLAIPFFSVFASNLYLYPQGAAPGKKTKPHEIEGTWTLVCGELGGELMIDLPRPALPIQGTGNVPVGAYLWKISGGKIEAGPNNELFPLDFYAYDLNPGKKDGAIDIVYRGRAREKLKNKTQGIYSIKGNWLFLCLCSDGRPERFSIAGKDPITTTTYVFRRGVVE